MRGNHTLPTSLSSTLSTRNASSPCRLAQLLRTGCLLSILPSGKAAVRGVSGRTDLGKRGGAGVACRVGFYVCWGNMYLCGVRRRGGGMRDGGREVCCLSRETLESWVGACVGACAGRRGGWCAAGCWVYGSCGLLERIALVVGSRGFESREGGLRGRLDEPSPGLIKHRPCHPLRCERCRRRHDDLLVYLTIQPRASTPSKNEH